DSGKSQGPASPSRRTPSPRPRPRGRPTFPTTSDLTGAGSLSTLHPDERMKHPTPHPDLVIERLAALGDMIRLRILRMLEVEALSVGEVAKVVQLPQSTVSRH